MEENKRKITIGINAAFARKPNTGIGQVTLNFLRKLSEYKVESKKYKVKFEFILYLEEDLPREVKLPKNFEKRIFLPIYKRDDLIRKIWWEKFLLPRRIKKDQCDIFISLYQCPTVIARSVATWQSLPLVSRLFRYARNDTKHIMVTHDIIPKFFPEYLDNARKEIYWRLTEKGIRSADRIIAISKRTEKDLIEHLKITADKITANYIDVDEVYKKPATKERISQVLRKYKLKPGYILAGGGYETRKNVEGAIRAYKMLLDRNKKESFSPEFPKLAIYGQLFPPSNPLALDALKLLKELNLTKQVRLLGMAAQKDLPSLFSSAVCFVYPSRYEGFGLPVLEAMNSGAPVITSKTSSLPEVGGDSVLYCRPDDVSDIAMVMKNVLTKKDLRDDLTRRGLERAKQFSWEKFVEKILNVTENLK